MGRGVTDALVEIAAPRRGERVLDVACGTGAPALHLARRVAPGGSVVGIDIAAEPLKVASERARQRGLTNTRFERADVHALPFEDNQFDLITCRFGVMFFSDLPRALREMRRVLRPGGRVAIAAWGSFDQPYFDVTANIVMRHTGAPLPSSAAAMFKFAAPGTMAAAFAEAGFSGASDEIRSVRWTWPDSIEQLWAYFQAVTVPFRPLFEGIRPEQRGNVERDIYRALDRYWDGRQVNLTAAIVLATAKKKMRANS